MHPPTRRSLWLLLLTLGGLAVFLAAPPSPRFFSGAVFDADGPVAGAEVRLQTDSFAVQTDALGRFRLPSLSGKRVTAARDGYFIGGAPAVLGRLRIQLERLPVEDDPAYAWVEPTADPAGLHNCGNCHAEITREWSASGHARSATNRRFLNLYAGTDWHGRPGVGWSLLAEHPDGAGVCTSCHAPTVGFGDPAFYDLRQVRGVDRHGVHCDYCHKIAGADEGTLGLTHGRFGLKLLRPTVGQLFFGPLPDIDRGEDAYAPFYRDSRYCASCHEGTVFGVPVYTTYSEYLASPARRAGKQCQDCHMTPTGNMSNLAPGHGGVRRNPDTLANHRFFADGPAEMLRRALTVTARLTRLADSVRVVVEVRADGVGHRLPTGFIDRHLVLVLEGRRRDETVAPLTGPKLPDRAGADLAGRPGRLFAKTVADNDGRRPVPFWRANANLEDTRLAPERADASTYDFPLDVERVRYRLIYRRFWPEVAREKGWPDDTVTVETGEWIGNH